MYIARQNGLLNDYDDEQLEILEENIKNVAQVARMRAKGRDRWGKDDYDLAFALKSGQVKLPDPKYALWDPRAHMMGFEEDQAGAIKRGLFNVRRWLGVQNDGKWLRKSQDPFPDLPGLDGSSLGAMLPIGLQGAGRKSGGVLGRYDLVPNTFRRDDLVNPNL